MSPRALTTTGRQACLNPAHTSHKPGAGSGTAATGGGWSKGMLQAVEVGWRRFHQVGAQATNAHGHTSTQKRMRTWVGYAWHRVLVVHQCPAVRQHRFVLCCKGPIAQLQCSTAQYNTLLESGQSAVSGSVRRSGTKCALQAYAFCSATAAEQTEKLLKGGGIRSRPAVPHPRRPKGVNSGGGLRVQALQVEGCQQGQGAAQAVACERRPAGGATQADRIQCDMAPKPPCPAVQADAGSGKCSRHSRQCHSACYKPREAHLSGRAAGQPRG